MRRTLRVTAGIVAMLFGTACLVMAVRIFLRTGPPEGAKAAAYLWLLPLVIPLPMSLGVNLLWGVVKWRVFTGWWLVAVGLLYLGGIFWILPDYQVTLPSLLLVTSPAAVLLLAG